MNSSFYFNKYLHEYCYRFLRSVFEQSTGKCKKGRFFKQKLCVFWMWIFEPILTCHQEFAYIGWEIRHSKLPVYLRLNGKIYENLFSVLLSMTLISVLRFIWQNCSLKWEISQSFSKVHPSQSSMDESWWKYMLHASLMSLLSKSSSWSLSLLEPCVKVHVQIGAAGGLVLLEVGEHLEVTKSKQNQNKIKTKTKWNKVNILYNKIKQNDTTWTKQNKVNTLQKPNETKPKTFCN